MFGAPRRALPLVVAIALACGTVAIVTASPASAVGTLAVTDMENGTSAASLAQSLAG
ncbi:MAG: hypothetical protein QOF95_1606, partial [Pseudonocardiales bacterium]|nr:hypothetical protein [Pseudonocardiales bacterium]